MKKIDIILFLFVGLMTGSMSTHLLWKEYHTEEIRTVIERSILLTDSEGNLYYKLVEPPETCCKERK